MTAGLAFWGTLSRLVTGLASLAATWLVLDNIHDRNTEIIVCCIGLLYCYIFLVSRRWQYYGLSAFSLFGRTIVSLRGEPYDQMLRDEVGFPGNRAAGVLTVLLIVATELLCAFRLLTSLLGHGWERLAAPIHALADWPELTVWLDKL